MKAQTWIASLVAAATLTADAAGPREGETVRALDREMYVPNPSSGARR